jgi:molecular chaperone DnaJ
MARNYYVILGVPPNASSAEIHTAYRRLAKASHPDVSGGDSSGRFQEVQEAWETLGDAERRRAYDTSLKRMSRQPSPPPEFSTQGWYDPRPIAKAPMYFMDDLFQGPGATYESTGVGEEIHFGLEMTAAEAATGGTMPLRIPVEGRCPECAGLGSYFFFLCPACQGTGCRSFWRTLTLQVPAGLTNHNTLEVPLAQLGLPYARLILHVHIEPP